MKKLITLVACLLTLFSVIKYSYALSFGNPLVDAVDRGDKSETVSLLQSGIFVDSEGDFEVTPLMRAAFRGNSDFVNLLIDLGAFLDAKDIGGETALHIATRNGHAQIVKILIEAGADVNVQDHEEWTPLMRAALSNKTKVAKLLIDSGASLTLKNDQNETVLEHIAKSGANEILKYAQKEPVFDELINKRKVEVIKIAEKKGNGLILETLSETAITTESTNIALPKAITFTPPVATAIIDNNLPWKIEERQAVISQKKTQFKTKNITNNSLKKTKKPFFSFLSFFKTNQLKKSKIENTTNNKITFQEKPFKVFNKKPIIVDNKTNYVVQLGKYNKQSDAIRNWNKLRKNANLKDDQPIIAQNNDKHILQIGYFNEKNANRKCLSLKYNKIDCLVTKDNLNSNIILAKTKNKNIPLAPTPLVRFKPKHLVPVAKTPQPKIRSGVAIPKALTKKTRNIANKKSFSSAILVDNFDDITSDIPNYKTNEISTFSEHTKSVIINGFNDLKEADFYLNMNFKKRNGFENLNYKVIDKNNLQVQIYSFTPSQEDIITSIIEKTEKNYVVIN